MSSSTGKSAALDHVLLGLDAQRETVIELQRRLVSINAIGPSNAGPGEREKADYLKGYLTSMGVQQIKELNATDSRTACGHRPNLAAIIHGRDTSKTFWVISHMDVVPVGDLKLWHSNPFELLVDGDRVTGRGVMDNHQGIISSVLLAKELLTQKIVPPINYGLLLVSDEETGNQYGVNYVAEKHANIFGKNDLFLIPDYGNAASELIDVAEKSVLWLKITVTGKQCHAAWPVRGNNSLVASAAFILKAKSLHDTFGDKDKLFDIPYSTFTPTKKENNVGSVNIMPGRDVFYMDCRVLPHYKLEDVIAAVNKIGKEIAKEYGVEISCEAVQSVQSVEKMSTDSEILKRLVPSIRSVYKNNPNPMGVSCFTVALGLRRAGHTVAVWATLEEMAHQPNETGSIAATIGDAKVLASVLLG